MWCEVSVLVYWVSVLETAANCKIHARYSRDQSLSLPVFLFGCKNYACRRAYIVCHYLCHQVRRLVILYVPQSLPRLPLDVSRRQRLKLYCAAELIASATRCQQASAPEVILYRRAYRVCHQMSAGVSAWSYIVPQSLSRLPLDVNRHQRLKLCCAADLTAFATRCQQASAPEVILYRSRHLQYTRRLWARFL